MTCRQYPLTMESPGRVEQHIKPSHETQFRSSANKSLLPLDITSKLHARNQTKKIRKRKNKALFMRGLGSATSSDVLLYTGDCLPGCSVLSPEAAVLMWPRSVTEAGRTRGYPGQFI